MCCKGGKRLSQHKKAQSEDLIKVWVTTFLDVFLATDRLYIGLKTPAISCVNHFNLFTDRGDDETVFE